MDRTFSVKIPEGCNFRCCQPNPCTGALSGDGIINISRGQYLALFNGGTLTMTVNFALDESWVGPPDAAAKYTGTATGTNSTSYSEACSASVHVGSTGPRFVENPPDPAIIPIDDIELDHNFSFSLGKDGDIYQVKYELTGSFVGISGGTGYPDLTVTMPGGDPGFVGTWSPAGVGNVGYANNSTLDIEISITSAAP